MKRLPRKAIAISALALCLLDSAICSEVGTFQSGSVEMTLDLEDGQDAMLFHLDLPAECSVLSASMKIAGAAPAGDSPAFAENVSVMLDGECIWTHDGPGYGALGRQSRLSDGQTEGGAEFPDEGGSLELALRLPKDCVVTNASFIVNGSGKLKVTKMAELLGHSNESMFGYRVAPAGDVNGDGYDDVLVSAPDDDSYGFDSGAVYLYFGGRAFNDKPGMIFHDGIEKADFGFQIEGSGDVNGDGHPDILITSEHRDLSGHQIGKVHCYLGGPNLDATPDLIFEGDPDTYFGRSISSNGDVNGDGCDDILIGAPYNDTGGLNSGIAFLYNGSPAPDNKSDIAFKSQAVCSNFGNPVNILRDLNDDGHDEIAVIAVNAHPDRVYLYWGGDQVSMNPQEIHRAEQDGDDCYIWNAGDMNGDGRNDVVVTAPNYLGRGRFYLYLGRDIMNYTADLTGEGEHANDYFGVSAACAGDINKDGYSDLIIGASGSDAGGESSGRVYIFCGGKVLNNDPDFMLTGEVAGDDFGHSVAPAGDWNADGFDEVIIGARGSDANGTDAGKACIYSFPMAVVDPEVRVANATAWKASSYFNGSVTVGDPSALLNEYLRSAPPTLVDAWGNAFVDIPLNLSAGSEGTLSVSDLKVTYEAGFTVPDFSAPLNDYIRRHRAGKDAAGRLSIPLTVRAATPGTVKLFELGIITDDAPQLKGALPVMEMDEDSRRDDLLDLHAFIGDDHDPAGEMNLSVLSATNSSIVRVEVNGGRYLAADALTGPENDNWTGAVEGVLGATDSKGSRSEIPFRIMVNNVNDPPSFTSGPVLEAAAGEPYIYQATAVDGDGDLLTHGLAVHPGGMAVDARTGLVSWTPTRRGSYEVSLTASDDAAVAVQDFSIVVPNQPPVFLDEPPARAVTGEPLSLVLRTMDLDGDPLQHAIASGPEGMRIDGASGRLEWLPLTPGRFAVVVTVTDGIAETVKELTVEVSQANRAPGFTTSPVLEATVGVAYRYGACAADPDGDLLQFRLVEGIGGMELDPATGELQWIPAADQQGNHSVTIRVTDGRGGCDEQAFRLTVVRPPPMRPQVLISHPENGTKLRGKVLVCGTAKNGSAPVLGVQLRVDGGAWTDAFGEASWSLELDTTRLKNGRHRIEARATDGEVFSDAASVVVFVTNPDSPFFTLENPFTGVILILGIGTLATTILVRKGRKGASQEYEGATDDGTGGNG